MERCGLCKREVSHVTRHHLIPRCRHRSKRARREASREEMNEVVLLCSPCHKTVHATLSEKELAGEYHTLEALAAHPDIARYLTWIRKRKGLAHLSVRRKR